MTDIDYIHPKASEPKVRKRKNFIVALLSFFMSGLGHVYIGEAKRGIILFFGETLLTVVE